MRTSAPPLAAIALADPAVFARPVVAGAFAWDTETRGLRAIRDALDEAIGHGEDGADLMPALLDRRTLIDAEAATLVFRCLTGLLAAGSGTTPESLLLHEAELAPCGAAWPADVSGGPSTMRSLDDAS